MRDQSQHFCAIIVALGVLSPWFSQAEEAPQPRVFLWTYGDVSNDEVLEIWNQLAELGIPMPTWKDHPNSEAGDEWDWSYFTNPDGEQVSPRRDKAYYHVAASMEYPLAIEFHHKPAKVESSCEFAVKRDAPMWEAITEVFVAYRKTKDDDPSFVREIDVFETQGDDQACRNATVEELLSNPKMFHGKRVRVSGYYHSEFEDSSFAAGPESVIHCETSFWLGGRSHFAKEEDIVFPNDEFITVEGVFTAGQSGHMGLWPGEITRLTRVEKSRAPHRDNGKKASRALTD